MHTVLPLSCLRECLTVMVVQAMVFERFDQASDRGLFSDSTELYVMSDPQSHSGRTRSHASSFSSTVSGAASSVSGMRSISTGTEDGASPWQRLRSTSGASSTLELFRQLSGEHPSGRSDPGTALPSLRDRPFTALSRVRGAKLLVDTGHSGRRAADDACSRAGAGDVQRVTGVRSMHFVLARGAPVSALRASASAVRCVSWDEPVQTLSGTAL